MPGLTTGPTEMQIAAIRTKINGFIAELRARDPKSMLCAEEVVCEISNWIMLNYSDLLNYRNSVERDEAVEVGKLIWSVDQTDFTRTQQEVDNYNYLMSKKPLASLEGESQNLVASNYYLSNIPISIKQTSRSIQIDQLILQIQTIYKTDEDQWACAQRVIKDLESQSAQVSKIFNSEKEQRLYVCFLKRQKLCIALKMDLYSIPLITWKSYQNDPWIFLKGLDPSLTTEEYQLKQLFHPTIKKTRAKEEFKLLWRLSCQNGIGILVCCALLAAIGCTQFALFVACIYFTNLSFKFIKYCTPPALRPLVNILDDIADVLVWGVFAHQVYAANFLFLVISNIMILSSIQCAIARIIGPLVNWAPERVEKYTPILGWLAIALVQVAQLSVTPPGLLFTVILANMALMLVARACDPWVKKQVEQQAAAQAVPVRLETEPDQTVGPDVALDPALNSERDLRTGAPIRHSQSALKPEPGQPPRKRLFSAPRPVPN